MPTSSSESVAIERPKTNSRIFAHTRWDIIPVAAAVLHCLYFFGMFYLFPRVPLWVMLILGFIYSVSISWNINGISHNFIHNPYFRSPLLNRLFSIMESVTVGFGQIFYGPRYSELALHLFPFAVLVFWPLPLLSERLLSALRRQSR